MKKPLLATLGYTVLTFTIAIVWHIVLFEPLYLSWGYFGENPGFLFGFLSILMQGLILSFGYSYLKEKIPLWKFVSAAGTYHWTVHVLAFAAKAESARTVGFIGLESVYLALQFGLYGLVLSLLWKKR